MKRQVGRLGMTLMGIVAVLIMGLFILEFVQIQIVREDEFYEKRYEQTTVSREIDPARGEILLRDGTPIVRNRTVVNIIFDAALMPKEKMNETILRTTQLLEQNSEEWVDTLPITKTEPFEFQNAESDEVAKLKVELKKQNYATVEDVLEKLYENYDLQETKLSPSEKRQIAGVRHEMERQNFSLKYSFTLAENISMETSMKVRENNIYFPGVTAQESSIREYANGTFAPHIWGVMGPIYKEDAEKYKELDYNMDEQVGKGGLEEAFESILRGKKGKSKLISNSSGDIVSTEVETPPVPGQTIQTTIDPKLQLIAQQSLERTIKKLQVTEPAGKGKEADSGVVIVLENETGNILAMAQYPSYDINEYRTKYSEILARKANPLFNRNLYGKYAPGSCYKPLIALAGLAEETITPESTVYCGGTYTFYEDYQPTCLSSHGNFTVKRALQRSCNIFFYDTGRVLGIEKINNYAKQLGLADFTGIEIPSEIGQLAGTKESLGDKKWVPGDVLQASIGQSGNIFSPLQIANYAATIARDGTLKETHLIDSILSYDGQEVLEKTQPVEIGKVNAPSESFQNVKEGMHMATLPGGTSAGWIGPIPEGLPVASKTGTPQTSPTTQNSVYIAFAPIENSKITVIGIIEDGWHGYTSAPMAGDIIRAYFFDDFADFDLNMDTATVQTDEEDEKE